MINYILFQLFDEKYSSTVTKKDIIKKQSCDDIKCSLIQLSVDSSIIDQNKDYLTTPLEWKIPQVDGDIDISDEELDNSSYHSSSDAHLSTNPMLLQSFSHDDIS